MHFLLLANPIISYKWNDDFDSLKIGTDYLYIRSKKRFYQYHFSEIISAELLSKKKLAPLVTGAIISSLAMVNIMLEGAGLYMVAFFFVGLLVLYFGLTEYWVIKIVQPGDSNLIWISKNKTPKFPEVILSVVHYRIKQGIFPPLFCQIDKKSIQEYIEEKNEANPSEKQVKYTLLQPKSLKGSLILKVDPTRLSKPLAFEPESGYLATGKYKINASALLSMEL